MPEIIYVSEHLFRNALEQMKYIESQFDNKNLSADEAFARLQLLLLMRRIVKG